MMRVITCEQGTPEWLAARAGKVTASRVADVLAKVKSGEAATRRNYKAQIVAEILTGAPIDDGYVSAAMLRGNEQEPLARAAYEVSRGVMVDQVGFVLHPLIVRAGCSPDGLIGDRGGMEIKCPNTATHIQWLLNGGVPAEHQPQMLWNMACCEREWWDFVSYDSRLPEHLQLFIARLARDEKRIEAMEAEVVTLLVEVEDIISRLPKAPTPEDRLGITEADVQAMSNESAVPA